MEDKTLLADGFDNAFIGYIERCGKPVMAVYSFDAAVDILMERDEMTEEEAMEFIEFDVIGAWLGEGTPGFLREGSLKDLDSIL